jgi:hypothetical protein
MIAVTIGVIVGLFMSQAIDYAFGSKYAPCDRLPELLTLTIVRKHLYSYFFSKFNFAHSIDILVENHAFTKRIVFACIP